MKRTSKVVFAALWLCFVVVARQGNCQETVTIPKSRLEELERKAAELEKLKGEVRTTRSEAEELQRKQLKAEAEKEQLQREKLKAEAEKRELQQAKETAEARAAATKPAEEVITRNTPKIAALPALAKGQGVDAMDLMNHYRTEPAAAEKRYEASRILVEGEIVGFDKPMLVSHCVVVLKTTARSWRVVCRLDPPSGLPVLFTARNGEELVGATSSGARTLLARVGQRATFEGWCKGLKEQSVTLSSAKLVGAR